MFDHVKAIVSTDKAPYTSRLLAGATTGCMAAGICSPLFMVKCRLQMQVSGAGKALGTQHGYRGLLHGLSCIYRESGARGLYRGMDGFVLRTAVGSAFQLGVFDVAKGPFQDQFGSWGGTLMASGTAGFAAATAMNPFDVVSTRLYNQPRGSDGVGRLYSGPIDCFAKSLRAEGPVFFFKGYVSHAGRLVPHSVYCLFFFELFRTQAERLRKH